MNNFRTVNTSAAAINFAALRVQPVKLISNQRKFVNQQCQLDKSYNYEPIKKSEKRKFKISAFLGASLLICNLTACTSIKDYAYQDYAVRGITLDGDSEVQKLLATISSLKDDDGMKFSFNDCTPSSKCQFDRNRIFARLIASSDVLCTAHLKTLYGNEASSNFILGSLTTIFTTLSAGAGGMVAKTNLAAIGAISSAERSLINDVVYKGALVPAVHQKILETRHSRRDGFSALYAADYASYPMERAVADAVDYHYTCSFMLGLQLALKEGTTNTQVLQLRSQVADAEAKLGLALMAFPGAAAQNNLVIEKNKARFITLSDALLRAELTAAKVAPEVTSLQPKDVAPASTTTLTIKP
jgi:hypothetical protein